MVQTLLLLLVARVPVPQLPPVRVWLGSSRTLASGDPTRVYVQTRSDGNLVVLHARTDGRVEVLFPGEPASDPFVRAGTYEIRGPTGGDAFVASTPEGRGMVVAALSPDPIWFDEFAQNGTWDATALTGTTANPDPEAVLTDVAQRMLGDGSFNYDVVTYTVTPRPAAVADAAGHTLQPAALCIECSFIRVGLLPFSHRRRRAPAAPAAGPAVPPAPPAIAAYSAHRTTAATRSLLLIRVTPGAGARRPEPVSSGVAAPARIPATGGLVAVRATLPGFVAATPPRVGARPDGLAGRTRAPQAGLVAPASARAASGVGVGFASPPYRRVAARETR
jgi:hypothetical protein